jgi:hypothetical protein
VVARNVDLTGSLDTDRARTRGGPRSVATSSGKASPKRKRGGGPSTAKGREVSSKNATRHGILSRSPIVGDEQQADWEEHLAGMRDSWRPMGHFEDVLTYEGALNRWRRSRLEQWSNGVVQHQIDVASMPSRDSLERGLDALPADEEYWFGVDTQAVLRTVDAIEEDASLSISTEQAAGILRALTVISGLHAGTAPIGPVPALTERGATVGEVQGWLDQVAEQVGATRDQVLSDVRREVTAALVLQRMRSEEDGRVQALALSIAYLPNDGDAGREMRYGAYLDREFERLVKNLEKFQRARQGTLSTPIRIEVDQS